MWQIYNVIQKLVDAGDVNNALTEIEKYRGECISSRFSPLLVLEASCIADQGTLQGYTRAVEILEEAATLDPTNFWIFYNLGHYLRHLERDHEALAAIRKSHCLVGWPESKEKGYEFTHDYFSGNIALWERWFAEVITVTPIDCLEVGSWQGASATWLLDKVVSPRGGLLTCIDTFTGSSEHKGIVRSLGTSLEALFDSNIDKSGHKGLCRKLVGPSQERLRSLPAEFMISSISTERTKRSS